MIPNPATTPSTPVPQPLRLQSPQPQWVPGNPQSAIYNPQSDHSDIPHSAFSIPHSDSLQSSSLHARGLALFSTLMALVEIILIGVVDLLAGSHHLPNAKALPLLDKAIRCLFSLGRLHLTLQRAPQHFTVRQVLRLSRAFEKIRYLTGQAFDFSPWTSLTPDQLASQKSPSPSQSPHNPQSKGEDPVGLRDHNPQSGIPQSAICNPQSAIPSVPATPATPPVAPVPNVNEVPAATVTATPGATLARICENLVELAEELGRPHHFETGFLPTQSLSPSQSEILNLKSEIPFSLSPSPSQSQSSGNLQSTICNLQSGNPQSSSVHSVHPVHNVHSVHSSHDSHPSHSSHSSHPSHSVNPASPSVSPHSAFPIPHSDSLSPALRAQLSASPSHVPLRPQSRAPS